METLPLISLIISALTLIAVAALSFALLRRTRKTGGGDFSESEAHIREDIKLLKENVSATVSAQSDTLNKSVRTFVDTFEQSQTRANENVKQINEQVLGSVREQAQANEKRINEMKEELRLSLGEMKEELGKMFAAIPDAEYLFPQIGARAAIAAWYGPMKKQQDFLLENSTGVEVKTTTGKSSDTLTISSEYQLDPTGFSSLYLYHLELVDLRDNTNTLNSLVDLIRTGCNDDPEALMDFSRKLVMSNYRQKDLEHYGSTSYAIRKESAYHVSDEFPCITGNDLKNGITNVKYSLSTAAIEQYTVEISDLIKCLKEGYM